jgi:hypothetical protein
MKKAILLAMITLLPACAGNNSRDIRTVIEAKPGSEVAIKACFVVISRKYEGNYALYNETARLVIGNGSTADAPVEAHVLAISKDGSVISETLIDGIAGAGMTTNLEHSSNVPAPVNWVEDHDFTATDSYSCLLVAPPSAAFFYLPGFAA